VVMVSNVADTAVSACSGMAVVVVTDVLYIYRRIG
jgi:hypothetical protein